MSQTNPAPRRPRLAIGATTLADLKTHPIGGRSWPGKEVVANLIGKYCAV